MIFRNIRIFIFVALLLNQNVRKNKSILILISSLIIQEVAISLMISTNIAKFLLDLVIVLTTIVFCIDLISIIINGILNYFKITKINKV